MKPTRLYIENFMCYGKSFIDFSQFSSALIIGKMDNSDLYSNGVGKTTIFKAIEYVLFNQCNFNLEKIIRDDTDECKVIFYFIVDSVEYRVSRGRTRKGTSDLSLYQKNNIIAEDIDIYHTDVDEKIWKDISSRRSSDTEKVLFKLVKSNYKSFRSTNYFVQNDYFGLAAMTPEKRKGVLKEALNLIIYSKLEKIAKDKATIINKEIEKNKVIIDSLGHPNEDLLGLSSKLAELHLNLNTNNNFILNLNNELLITTDCLNSLNNEYSLLETNFKSLVIQSQTLSNEKSKLETSYKDFTTKKSNILKFSNELVENLKELRLLQNNLALIDYSQIEALNDQINVLKEEITKKNINIQNNIIKYEELKIPLPNDDICNHCRQVMTLSHKKECLNKINTEIKECQDSIRIDKESIKQTNIDIANKQKSLNDIYLSKQKLENINTEISNKTQELKDKQLIFNEYSEIIINLNKDLSDKLNNILLVEKDLEKSSVEEANKVKIKIENTKTIIGDINNKILLKNKEISHLNNSVAVIQHDIDKKIADKIKLEELLKVLSELEYKCIIHQEVIKGFSSLGIPNLIIQNVLDDLQVETNNLLTQLKPGLQLSFVVEKTQNDDTEVDTLDIKYFINSKERYYEQLSGAQQLSIAFSLKLGLSFLLQKIVGTDIKILLLDEVDQPLDKASIDAFADIVKFFQKDFIILVITHNDRIKEKFSHAILVEQDIRMVSRAEVVTSW